MQAGREEKKKRMEKFVPDGRPSELSVIGIGERVNAEESANLSAHKHVGI